MKLETVTITGADDSTRPEDLLKLSGEFPWVEWGILVSPRLTFPGGSPRFPSPDWLAALAREAGRNRLNLSLHVCGRWVRDLLVGSVTLPYWMLEGFRRVQLNFHAEKVECRPHDFFYALHYLGKRQIIFQIDGVIGNEHYEAIDLEDVEENAGGSSIDAVPLFDVSGGAGILPAKWPAPYYRGDDRADDAPPVAHGYAGGLGPDNLAEQLSLIAAAAGDCRTWIDMETRVRSDDDALFDLCKVRYCLEIAKGWIKEGGA